MLLTQSCGGSAVRALRNDAAHPMAACRATHTNPFASESTARRTCMTAASSREGDDRPSEGAALAVEFSSLLNAQGLLQSHQRPSPMIPPTTVVETIMAALQRNDYPEEDEGVNVAYMFSKPHGCEGLLVGQAQPGRARGWTAHENWLSPEQFASMLHSKPYEVLLGCHEWKAASALRFPSKRFTNKAIQAIQVQHGVTSDREHLFTFCLERIDLGPYKGCWLVVGVRQGNYAKGM